MTQLSEAFRGLDDVLNRNLPDVANRLQTGLSRSEIDALVKDFSWTLPPDLYELYQWHDGLAVPTSKMSLVERLLRQKDKWHGELSGRENELHISYDERHFSAKFMPLEYALAGHRHLKLGRCFLNLLPAFVLNEDKTKWYCMFRLDKEKSTLYCANGSKVLPRGIDETFVESQFQFDCLANFIGFATTCGQQLVKLENQNEYYLKSLMPEFA